MYSDVYCHTCGFLVCSACGCCSRVSCSNCYCPHVAEDRAAFISDDIINSYEDGVCPDCGLEIPSNVVDGGECLNCGHIFYASGIEG
jgi:hypothetical protein